MGYIKVMTHLLTIDPNFQRVILVLAGAWKGAKELFLQCSKYILEKGLVQFVLQN